MRKTPLKRKKRIMTHTPLKKQGSASRKKRRQAQTQALHRSPEFLAAKAEAMERAGGRCEQTMRLSGVYGRGVPYMDIRCPVLDTKEHPLHAHLLSYGATGRIKASRIVMLCEAHHMAEEARIRPWNKNRLGRAS